MININDLEAGRELDLLIHRYLYDHKSNNEVMDYSTSPKHALDILSNIMQATDVLISATGSPGEQYFELSAFNHKVGDSEIETAICKCALMVVYCLDAVDMSENIDFTSLEEIEE